MIPLLSLLSNSTLLHFADLPLKSTTQTHHRENRFKICPIIGGKQEKKSTGKRNIVINKCSAEEKSEREKIICFMTIQFICCKKV